jgi:hypothetical protein
MDLERKFIQLQEQAELLAGSPQDIPQRVVLMHEMYLDSGKNHWFPQVALHGALWAHGYFASTGSLGKALSLRYFYDDNERRMRGEMLDKFSDAFKRANRQVFIDTFTNYYFTKEHRTPQAERIVGEQVFSALAKVHDASKEGRTLSPSEQREAFIASLSWEQETTVAPAIAAAISEFDCPILRTLCLKPTVKFSYFPAVNRMFFRDFSNKEERINKAIRAYDIAQQAGPDVVTASMKNYNILAQEFFRDPAVYAQRMRTTILTSTYA